MGLLGRRRGNSDAIKVEDQQRSQAHARQSSDEALSETFFRSLTMRSESGKTSPSLSRRSRFSFDGAATTKTQNNLTTDSTFVPTHGRRRQRTLRRTGTWKRAFTSRKSDAAETPAHDLSRQRQGSCDDYALPYAAYEEENPSENSSRPEASSDEEDHASVLGPEWDDPFSYSQAMDRRASLGLDPLAFESAPALLSRGNNSNTTTAGTSTTGSNSPGGTQKLRKSATALRDFSKKLMRREESRCYDLDDYSFGGGGSSSRAASTASASASASGYSQHGHGHSGSTTSGISVGRRSRSNTVDSSASHVARSVRSKPSIGTLGGKAFDFAMPADSTTTTAGTQTYGHAQSLSASSIAAMSADELFPEVADSLPPPPSLSDASAANSPRSRGCSPGAERGNPLDTLSGLAVAGVRQQPYGRVLAARGSLDLRNSPLHRLTTGASGISGGSGVAGAGMPSPTSVVSGTGMPSPSLAQPTLPTLPEGTTAPAIKPALARRRSSGGSVGAHSAAAGGGLDYADSDAYYATLGPSGAGAGLGAGAAEIRHPVLESLLRQMQEEDAAFAATEKSMLNSGWSSEQEIATVRKKREHQHNLWQRRLDDALDAVKADISLD